MLQAGPSRIPTFGSRLPQPLPKAPSTFELSKQHIGKLVRVADKEGILRFIGNVHFTSGIWCGVELPSPIGKNDGSVQGVRYFACATSHGVMAPLSKTTIVDRGSCESLNDDLSGPHSILFIDGQFDRTVPRTVTHNLGRITRSIEYPETNKSPKRPNREQNNIDRNSETIINEKNHQGTTIDIPDQENLTFTRVVNELTETVDTPSTDRNETYDIDNKHFTYSPCELNQSLVKNKSQDNTLTNSSEDITEENYDENNYQHVVINRSCENLLNESNIEAKRRRTSVSSRSGSYSEDRRTLLLHLSKQNSSTPLRPELADYFLRKLRISAIQNCPDKSLRTYEESNSKRNSLERDESSLGILTPDQLEYPTFPGTRSPSLEYELSLNDPSKSEVPSPRDESLGLLDEKCFVAKSLKEDVPNHLMNLMDCTVDESAPKTMSAKKSKENSYGGFAEQRSSTNSLAEPSLGLLDEHMINLSAHTDFPNLKLLLDNKSGNLLTRLEETPSPEELPFDPTPIVELDPKSEPSKVKSGNSFVTSITSITSLDTGYQGDGEMSRPASRGAENSPLTRRPVPRPQTRRPDPMTDSDFYTESDAEVQEENPLRGDRKAQVIDGTLYGVDPQAAADIYVNNRENMDSSGIFTDLETNTRTEEESNHVEVPDVSPSDSTKTLSANSQNNIQEILDRTMEKKINVKELQKENPKKRIATSPVTSSPTARYGSKGVESSQKYKIPKREVVSKVKTLLNAVPMPKVVKKPVNKWDAVMNKISKSEQIKTNLKDIKSKVFSDIQLSPMPKVTQNDSNRNSPRAVASPKIVNNKL